MKTKTWFLSAFLLLAQTDLLARLDSITGSPIHIHHHHDHHYFNQAYVISTYFLTGLIIGLIVPSVLKGKVLSNTTELKEEEEAVSNEDDLHSKIQKGTTALVTSDGWKLHYFPYADWTSCYLSIQTTIVANGSPRFVIMDNEKKKVVPVVVEMVDKAIKTFYPACMQGNEGLLILSPMPQSVLQWNI